MTTFNELYQRLLADTVKNIDANESDLGDFDYDQLDCLLHPEKHPPVWHFGQCECDNEQQSLCIKSCPFNAMTTDHGSVIINDELCVGCGACLDCCSAKKLTTSKDVIPALKAIINNKNLSYALIAPAFLGQFSPEVTPGKLRTALKMIGFDGVIEVSLFADILTLKESLEFTKNIHTEADYQLTSCCCPVWIALIRRVYQQLMPHVPGSVSPMIASGRTIKQLYPDALTVFIGPCLAKKAEAKEADLKGAIDYVLTFQEINDIFTAMKIDPAKVEESDKDHSSRSGRIYAYTGGVSEAVKNTVSRLSPDNPISVKTQQADGIPACKALIQKLTDGEINANFYEGMGCVGGCVGGPKAIIDKEQGKKNVSEYGDKAQYPTPIDNPYVIELLHQLGFDTIEDLLEDSELFTRHF